MDRATVELLERWGTLPSGTADKVNEDVLKNATRDTLTRIADDLATEIEKEHAIRETALDLDRMRWPADITIYADKGAMLARLVVPMDRMGRYYIRYPDVQKEWLIPGYMIKRNSHVAEGGYQFIQETILEAHPLFHGETPVCWQVTTRRDD